MVFQHFLASLCNLLFTQLTMGMMLMEGGRSKNAANGERAKHQEPFSGGRRGGGGCSGRWAASSPQASFASNKTEGATQSLVFSRHSLWVEPTTLSCKNSGLDLGV